MAQPAFTQKDNSWKYSKVSWEYSEAYLKYSKASYVSIEERQNLATLSKAIILKKKKVQEFVKQNRDFCTRKRVEHLVIFLSDNFKINT